MSKYTCIEAIQIVKEASEQCKEIYGYRIGQAIANLLDDGGDSTLFYEIDHQKAVKYFYDNYVSQEEGI